MDGNISKKKRQARRRSASRPRKLLPLPQTALLDFSTSLRCSEKKKTYTHEEKEGGDGGGVCVWGGAKDAGTCTHTYSLLSATTLLLKGGKII